MTSKTNCEYKLIKCGKLYDGITDEFQENMEILIKGKLIEEVGKDLKAQSDCELIDLSDATVTPGMIDAHVHMTVFDWRNAKNETLFNTPVYKSMAALYNAERFLRRGFTTVRHMGGKDYDGYGVLDAKRVINEGYFPGSRLWVMPYVQCTVGSHGDSSQVVDANPHLAEFLGSSFPTMGSGADFFHNSVREQVKYGADFVKMMANGGFSTPYTTPDTETMTSEEMQAVIEAAHALNKKVTAHVYAPHTIIKLANMGIDCLEHCSLITEEAAAVVEKEDVYIVPTFAPFEEIIRWNEENLSKKDPEFQAKLRVLAPRLVAGRDIIVNSKIKLGFGSDIVAVHECYESAYEYESWMLSGMNPFRALRAATATNADILQMADKIGTIEAGKLADIAAWRRDLLTDPKALFDCAFVMKDGKVYETEAVE